MWDSWTVAEGQLVAGCLRGDDEAWERLYRCCQRSLLLFIKVMLGPEARDESLVDEMASQVWLWLVEDDHHRLKTFDSSRGRLVTYFAALARESIQRHRRSQSRGAVQNATAAADSITTAQESLASFESSLKDFLSTLTPHQRRFCERHLLASPDSPSHLSYSPANARQLRHRVFVRLQKHIN